MTITISDQARAIHALEEERKCLYVQSRSLSEKQVKLAEEFKQEIIMLSTSQRNVMRMMVAIDDNMKKLLSER